MGGRGAGSGGGIGGRGEQFIADSDGSNIDLGDAKLKYGGDDKAVAGAQRTATVAQETKRLTASVEYCQGFDANGNPVAPERRGGATSVRPYRSQVDAEVFTHNHPREKGVLGGTFSYADLSTFDTDKGRTIRASAKEGTYSLTKGKNFNGMGLKAHYRQVIRTAETNHASRVNQLKAQLASGAITKSEYNSRRQTSFNMELVEMHNGLIAGASQYGYTYTLERRK